MRIVFLRSNSVMPDPRVEKEVNSLLKSGHKLQILAWNRKKSKSKIKEGIKKVTNGEVPITWFNIKAEFGGGFKSNIIPLTRFQISLIFWLIKNKKNYDVIHACDFDTVIPAFICSKIFKKKYIYDIFDYYVDAFNVPRKLRKIIESIDIYMINKSNATIIVNESRKVQIKKTKPKNLVIIHNSPNKYQIRNDDIILKSKSNKIKFGYVGLLSHDRLLKEILSVFSVKKDWELHIGGFGILQDYVEKFSEKYENIYFYGKLSYDQTLNLESEVDIMFATYNPKIENHKYSSPNKLYEAMMLEKPIIVCKDTGIDKLVKDEYIGEVISYDKENFILGAEKLIKRINKWDLIKHKMNYLFNEQYSWDKMEKRLLDLYSSIENK